jgi:ActR/RegA family two-component response regulator
MTVKGMVKMADQRRDVLLIDDNPARTGALSSALNAQGFAVGLATDAKSALEAVRANKFVFAIAELQLADMSAFELMRKVRTLRPEQRPSFILLASEVGIDMLMQAVRLRAVNILQLPVHPSEIVEAVRNAELLKPSSRLTAPPEPFQAARLLLLGEDKRRVLFGVTNVDDARWEIITELYLAQAVGQTTSVSDALNAAGIANTSAVRRLAELVDEGIVLRKPDQNDHRRVVVSLTPSALETVQKFYSWFSDMAATLCEPENPLRRETMDPFPARLRHFGRGREQFER